MWCCWNDGFVSIVQSSEYENILVVRARRREVLERNFPGSEIFVTEMSDYRYRLFADYADVAVVLMAKVFSIEYGNFKNSVSDPDLYALYSDFWWKHSKYQR